MERACVGWVCWTSVRTGVSHSAFQLGEVGQVGNAGVDADANADAEWSQVMGVGEARRRGGERPTKEREKDWTARGGGKRQPEDVANAVERSVGDDKTRTKTGGRQGRGREWKVGDRGVRAWEKGR